MKFLVQYALVMFGALLVGAGLVVASFDGMDFVWAHFVAIGPDGADLSDAVTVVDGIFAIASILGLAGLISMLYRSRPKRMSA